MTSKTQPLADAVELALRDAVEIIRAELFVRYVHDWARVGGRSVPWDYLRHQARDYGIAPDRLAVALMNLQAGRRQIGDLEVIDLPMEPR